MDIAELKTINMINALLMSIIHIVNMKQKNVKKFFLQMIAAIINLQTENHVQKLKVDKIAKK